jgi:hypothetical protein
MDLEFFILGSSYRAFIDWFSVAYIRPSLCTNLDDNSSRFDHICRMSKSANIYGLDYSFSLDV